jgi:hypothetical protein
MVSGNKKGRLVFLTLLLLGMVVALAAYQLSGDMDIEERFSHAVGSESPEEEGGGNGWFGLTLEGNPLLYGIVLGVLAAGSYAAYRYLSV